MNIVCVSHLRWSFVFQRPQQLLSRAARNRSVLYIEEPSIVDGATGVRITRHDGVMVLEPRVSSDVDPVEHDRVLLQLIAEAIDTHMPGEFILWYYTPMALPFTYGLNAALVVYDCMDELSAFAGAPPELRALEGELFHVADVVFTGGHSLYEAKRQRHPRVHAFPSSVDVPHFAQARRATLEPSDQASIPGPRIGFFGVIDERMDYDLLRAVAELRPQWHLVLVGPTVKVSAATLPRTPNIHYLGGKSYADLPAYIAGWDVAMLPFARNESTKFISPTKTPEYLAAGKPVVSTSIRDVVAPYGEQGLARIADSPADFVAAIEAALRADGAVERGRKADEFLAHMSWDRTWQAIEEVLQRVSHEKHKPRGSAGAARAAVERDGFRQPCSEQGEACSTISS